jgi:GT2 family glycosyltransferase
MTSKPNGPSNGVSVIIPTYNRADLLGRAIKSALEQTITPAEVIVVDDGSTDNTAAVVQAFGNRVRYMRVPNGGVSRARNAGIAAATGDWVALLDSDDIWEPSKLETQLALATGTPEIEWIVTGCVVVDTEGTPAAGAQSFEAAFPLFREFGIGAEAFFEQYLRRVEIDAGGARHVCFVGDFFRPLFYGNVALPSSALIRLSLLRSIGAFEETLRVGEDTEFFHRAAAAKPGAVVMTPLVRYRYAHTDSLTAGANAIALSEVALRSLDTAIGRRLASADEHRAYETGKRRLLLRLAYAYLSVRDRPGVRRTLRRLSPGTLGAKGFLLWAVSLAPDSVLRALHSGKQSIRRLSTG